MWKLVVFLFIGSIGLSATCSDCHEIDAFISNLVADASSALFFPSVSISSLLCAKTETIVAFSKILSENHVMSLNVNLDDFPNEIPSPNQQSAFVLDLHCPKALEILNKANDSGLFSAPVKWIILQEQSGSWTDDRLLGSLGGYAIYPDSEIMILRRISDDRAIVSSVYRPSPVRDMILEHRGFWKMGEGFSFADRHAASRRRRNLRATPLKSAIVITNPETVKHLTDYQDKHVDTITKCNYVWLHHLVAAMNATVTYSTVNTWGYRDKNGSWNGLMGMLSRKEIDLGGTSMFLVGDRWEDAHFIPLSTPTRAAFIFRQPPLSFVSNLFALPFRPAVWVSIAVLLGLILALLCVSTKWEWSARGADSVKRRVPPTLSDNLLLMIGSITQQGFGRKPRSISSRIVLLMLLLAVLNLYASYTANIVALLQSTTTSIQTVKHLLDSPIKCGAQDIVYNRYYFKMERDPVRRRLIEQKIEPKAGKANWLPADEGIRLVRAGLFAFYMELGPGYKIIQETFEEDEKCGFREIYFVEHFDPMFAITLKSPYVEILRVGSMKIVESGLKSREMSLFYTKRPQCNGLNKFISVGINECYFAFYVMGSGILFAFSILLLEVAWMKSASIRRKLVATTIQIIDGKG